MPARAVTMEEYCTYRAQLEVKLVIERKKNRVVFAEVNHQFVDSLLSFLTLPVATVAGLLSSKPPLPLGCMGHLLKSVESLDADGHLMTKACRAMLLSPRSSYDDLRRNLKLHPRGVDIGSLTKLYLCPSWTCDAPRCQWFSIYPDTLCACGKTMVNQSIDTVPARCHRYSKVFDFSFRGEEPFPRYDPDGAVFVRGRSMYMVTEDLRIMKCSMENVLATLKKFRVKIDSSLVEIIVKVGSSEILKLLKRSFVSSTPLTDVFLNNEFNFLKWILAKRRSETASADSVREAKLAPPSIEKCMRTRISSSSSSSSLSSSSSSSSSEKTITVKLMRNKANGDVIYAEAGEDFADFILSFLTLPLGAVINLLDGSSSFECLDNIYQSVEELSDYSNCIKSKRHKLALVSPQIPTPVVCDNQLFKIEERREFRRRKSSMCDGCARTGRPALVGANPKSPAPGAGIGGGYVKGPNKFTITDSMHVSPFAGLRGFREGIRKKYKSSSAVCLDDLEEEKLTLGEAEGLKLLKACLTSRGNALTDAFSA